MKKRIVLKGNKYKGKWMLESNDVTIFLVVAFIVVFVCIQLARSI